MYTAYPLNLHKQLISRAVFVTVTQAVASVAGGCLNWSLGKIYTTGHQLSEPYTLVSCVSVILIILFYTALLTGTLPNTIKHDHYHAKLAHKILRWQSNIEKFEVMGALFLLMVAVSLITTLIELNF